MRRKVRDITLGLSVLCCGIAGLVVGSASETGGFAALLPSGSVLKGWIPEGTPQLDADSADLPELFSAATDYGNARGGGRNFSEERGEYH